MPRVAPQFSPLSDHVDQQQKAKWCKKKKKRRRVRDIHASMIVSGASALRIEFADMMIARIIKKIDASFMNSK